MSFGLMQVTSLAGVCEKFGTVSHFVREVGDSSAVSTAAVTVDDCVITMAEINDKWQQRTLKMHWNAYFFGDNVSTVYC